MIGEDVAQVVLGRVDGDDVIITLRERTVHLGTPATCRSTVEAVAHEYDLVSVESLAAHAGQG